MTHESYKAWLDEMPIDDVRRRIERLEKKLWDLHVLERLYAERPGGGEDTAGEERIEGEGGEQGEERIEGEGGEQGEEHEQGEHGGEPSHEHGEEYTGG
jgi:hypothetical protein